MKVVVGHWSSSVVSWWRKSRRVEPSRRIRQTPVVTRRRGTRSQNCSHHQCTSPQVSAPARSKRHDRSDENVVDHHQLRNRRNPSRRQTLLGWRGSLDRASLTNTVTSTAVYTWRVDALRNTRQPRLAGLAECVQHRAMTGPSEVRHPRL